MAVLCTPCAGVAECHIGDRYGHFIATVFGAVWRQSCNGPRSNLCRYGNAVNVQRTVRGFTAAGFAGILLEDQVAPKSCGHVRGKQVVSRAEAVSRVRAAADARRESWSYSQ